MKKITLLIASAFCIAAVSNSIAQSAETVDVWNENPVYNSSESPNTGTNYQVMGGVIYSNGPYFNQPGGGSGGADLSLLQTSLGSNILGFGHSSATGFRVADDWVVANNVVVSSIDFYAYQTGATTTSTMNFVTLQIWDGDPSDPASNVIYGDNALNALSSTAWSGAYRASEGNEGNTDRAIMANTVNTPGLALAPGTYWLDWDAGGTLASGPWAPPISIFGQPATGNGLQFDPNTSTWGPLTDSGNFELQGLPFDVTGTVLGLDDNSFEGFTYYPNPVRNVLNVNAQATIENISIYNVLGQELINVSPSALNSKIDIAGLSTGMYVMKATVNGVVGSFNIVKK